MKRTPPKNDVERLENALSGIAAPSDDEIPEADDVKREAEAAGIDFAKWGDAIRQKARKKQMDDRKDEIEKEMAAYERAASKIGARPRPAGSREDKIMQMRVLVVRAEGRAISAHFRKFEEASDEALDELIVALETLLEDDEKNNAGRAAFATSRGVKASGRWPMRARWTREKPTRAARRRRRARFGVHKGSDTPPTSLSRSSLTGSGSSWSRDLFAARTR